MVTKLYVGNLSYNTSESDLSALFSEVGSVTSATIIKDRDSGQSKGFGFVEMGSQTEAEAAITRFNGSMFGSREMKVNIARPREDRAGRGGGRQGNYGRQGGNRGRQSGSGGSRSKRKDNRY
ncbi:RNA recognition motif domain-containing protein [Chloroflexota bacterium]